MSIDDALSWPQEPEKAAEQHCDFLGQWQKLTDGLQDARTAMKKKWKNMKTGGRTPKGLQEMLENVFGNAQPGKASLPKSEPVKASKSVRTDAVEPVKAKGFVPTKSQSREEVEPAKAVEALVIQKVRIQSSEDEAACSEIDAITVSSVVSVSCSQLEKAKETKSNKGLKRPSKAVPNKKPALLEILVLL